MIHVAMFPWFAYGHFIPFLHLGNKLAERGHRVSFLLPKSAQHKLQQLNHHPDLIRFFPLSIPQLQGLPNGAETVSDVPFPLHDLLCTAFDQTRDQVETILATLRLDLVFTDMAYWVPSLGIKLKFKTLFYNVVGASGVARLVPSKKVTRDMPLEELIETPPGYPSQKLRFKANEVGAAKFTIGDFGSGLSLYERLTISLKDCDAIAMRTCLEIEGPFCNYIAREYKKPVLVTGSVLPETPVDGLEEKWTRWLSKFDEGSVVFCALGSQITLQKDQFQELLLGLESSGCPFLVALSPPEGCKTVEEALPEGFEHRVRERGWVYGGWVPQTGLLNHPSVGCFVSHCGYGSMWESLVSDCQIVLVPFLIDQIIHTRLLVEELKVAVEVERSGENRWISADSLSQAVDSVMDKTSEMACRLKSNHAKLKNTLSRKSLQEEYIDAFVKDLQSLKNSVGSSALFSFVPPKQKYHSGSSCRTISGVCQARSTCSATNTIT